MAGKESLESPNVISYFLVGAVWACPMDPAVHIATKTRRTAALSRKQGRHNHPGLNKWCIWLERLFATTLKIKKIAGESRSLVIILAV